MPRHGYLLSMVPERNVTRIFLRTNSLTTLIIAIRDSYDEPDTNTSLECFDAQRIQVIQSWHFSP
jgi:hypothetical protein